MAGGDGVAADLDPLHVVRRNALRPQDVENRVDLRMQLPTGGVGLHIATRHCEFFLNESVCDLRNAIAAGEGLQQLVLAFEYADRPAEASLGRPVQHTAEIQYLT